MIDETFEHFQDLIEEDEVPSMSLRMVVKIGPNGETRWSCAISEIVSSAMLLGYLEQLKFHLMSDPEFSGRIKDEEE